MSTKSFNKILVSLILFLLYNALTIDTVHSILYKWKDKEGQIHITDYPPPTVISPEDQESDEKTAGTDAFPSEDPGVQAPVIPDTTRESESPLPATVMEEKKPEKPAKPSPAPVTIDAISEKKEEQPVKADQAPVSSGMIPDKKTDRPAPPVKAKTKQKVIKPQVAPSPNAGLKQKAVRPGPVKKSPKRATESDDLMIKARAFIDNLFVSADITTVSIAGGIVVFMLLSILYYFLSLYRIAKRLDLGLPWLAWAPVANFYTMVKAADKPWWWILLFLPAPLLAAAPLLDLASPIIAAASPLIFAFIYLIVWVGICNNLNINNKLAYLTLIPFLGPVAIIPVIVFSTLLIPLITETYILILMGVLFLTSFSVCYLPGYYLRKSNENRYSTEMTAAFDPDEEERDFGLDETTQLMADDVTESIDDETVMPAALSEGETGFDTESEELGETQYNFSESESVDLKREFSEPSQEINLEETRSDDDFDVINLEEATDNPDETTDTGSEEFIPDLDFESTSEERAETGSAGESAGETLAIDLEEEIALPSDVITSKEAIEGPDVSEIEPELLAPEEVTVDKDHDISESIEFEQEITLDGIEIETDSEETEKENALSRPIEERVDESEAGGIRDDLDMTEEISSDFDSIDITTEFKTEDTVEVEEIDIDKEIMLDTGTPDSIVISDTKQEHSESLGQSSEAGADTESLEGIDFEFTEPESLDLIKSEPEAETEEPSKASSTELEEIDLPDVITLESEGIDIPNKTDSISGPADSIEENIPEIENIETVNEITLESPVTEGTQDITLEPQEQGITREISPVSNDIDMPVELTLDSQEFETADEITLDEPAESGITEEITLETDGIDMPEELILDSQEFDAAEEITLDEPAESGITEEIALETDGIEMPEELTLDSREFDAADEITLDEPAESGITEEIALETDGIEMPEELTLDSREFETAEEITLDEPAESGITEEITLETDGIEIPEELTLDSRESDAAEELTLDEPAESGITEEFTLETDGIEIPEELTLDSREFETAEEITLGTEGVEIQEELTLEPIEDIDLVMDEDISDSTEPENTADQASDKDKL